MTTEIRLITKRHSVWICP